MMKRNDIDKNLVAHQGVIGHVFIGDAWSAAECACGLTVADVERIERIERVERLEAYRHAAIVCGIIAAGAAAYLLTKRVHHRRQLHSVDTNNTTNGFEK